jgi:hypothetical protein
MIKKILSIAIIAGLSFTGAVQAEEPDEPEIIIRQMEDKVVHEYRINGFTYAIKIVPNKGKPYYLVAEDGGDQFMRVDEPRRLIPRWEIFTWD